MKTFKEWVKKFILSIAFIEDAIEVAERRGQDRRRAVDRDVVADREPRRRRDGDRLRALRGAGAWPATRSAV